MRVLVVDMFGCRYPDLGYQISSALRSLGHEVRAFNYRKWKLQHLGITNRILNRLIVRAATGWPADLVVVNKGESILPGTMQKIRNAGIKTANWNPDEPFGEIQAFNRIQNVAEYDAFFTYDLQYLKRLKEVNPHSYYLPPGADPFDVHKEHVPLPQRSYSADVSADVCLVGSAYQNRIDLMNKLLKYRLSLAGPGWNSAPPEIARQARPPVKINEMVGMFNQSKIILNPYGASKSFIVPNPRTFEIPASRSFELTDASRDVNRFFALGKEIVVYHNEKEFMELVEYYLAHDAERNKIAQAGYDRVVKEHTMTHRVAEILKTLKMK